MLAQIEDGKFVSFMERIEDLQEDFRGDLWGINPDQEGELLFEHYTEADAINNDKFFTRSSGQEPHTENFEDNSQQSIWVEKWVGFEDEPRS